MILRTTFSDLIAHTREAVMTAVTNVKIGAATATATTATGTATFFDLIPDDIGKLASLFGIVLTTVLIFTHLLKLFTT